MKFLAVLIVVFLYRHWVGDNPVRFRVPYDQIFERVRAVTSMMALRLGLCVFVPVILVFALDWFLRHELLGLPWLLLSLLCLVYAIDMTDTGALFSEWQRRLEAIPEAAVENEREAQWEFRLGVIYQVFQGLFPPIFWFLLVGPAGAILHMLTRQYLDRLPDEDTELDGVDRFLYWLEWPAARLTGLVFAFLGNFGTAVEHWLETLRDSRESTDSVVARLAIMAISTDAENRATDADEFRTASLFTNRQLQQLLDRTILGWVGIAALAIILGL